MERTTLDNRSTPPKNHPFSGPNPEEGAPNGDTAQYGIDPHGENGESDRRFSCNQEKFFNHKHVQKRAIRIAIGAKQKKCGEHVDLLSFVQCKGKTVFRDSEAVICDIKPATKDTVIKELLKAGLLEVTGRRGHAKVYRLGPAFEDGRWAQWKNEADKARAIEYEEAMKKTNKDLERLKERKVDKTLIKHGNLAQKPEAGEASELNAYKLGAPNAYDLGVDYENVYEEESLNLNPERGASDSRSDIAEGSGSNRFQTDGERIQRCMYEWRDQLIATGALPVEIETVNYNGFVENGIIGNDLCIQIAKERFASSMSYWISRHVLSIIANSDIEYIQDRKIHGGDLGDYNWKIQLPDSVLDHTVNGRYKPFVDCEDNKEYQRINFACEGINGVYLSLEFYYDETKGFINRNDESPRDVIEKAALMFNANANTLEVAKRKQPIKPTRRKTRQSRASHTLSYFDDTFEKGLPRVTEEVSVTA